MRVLMSGYGGVAHIQPMLPLARALVERGHDLRFAAQHQMATLIEEAGVTSLGLFEDAQFPITTAELTAKSALGLARLSAYCQDWTPDVVVREWSELGALMVATHHGIPCVACGVKIRPPARDTVEHPCLALMDTVMNSLPAGSDIDLSRLMTRQTAVAGRRAGTATAPSLDMATLFGDLWLSFYPPSLAWPSTGTLSREHFFRVPVDDGTTAEPEFTRWMQANDDPLVYLTLGTSVNGLLDVFRAALAALDGLPVRVAVSVGRDQDPAVLGDRGPAVFVARYIPHSAVLPRCAAAVVHGGFNTVLGALTYGVPFVCIPVNGDQPVNAQRCEALGVSLTCGDSSPDALEMRAPKIDPAALREQIRRILDETTFRTAAQAISVEIAGLPPAEAGVGLIEELAPAE